MYYFGQTGFMYPFRHIDRCISHLGFTTQLHYLHADFIFAALEMLVYSWGYGTKGRSSAPTR